MDVLQDNPFFCGENMTRYDQTPKLKGKIFPYHYPAIVMKHLAALLLQFVLLVIPCPLSFAQDEIVLNTSAEPPLTNLQETGILDLIYREAFSRLGYQLKISRIPAERAMTNVNEGIDDGKYIKIAGLSELYPDTIQVPESSIDYEFIVFTKHEDFKVTGFDSLKPYNVAFINGWKILEKNVVGTASVTRLENARLLFTLLAKDRVDLVIYARLEGMALLQEMGLRDIKILEPPLIVKEMFLYLNKKYAPLVPQIAAALHEMKKDGTYKRLFDQALEPYLRDRIP